MPSTAKTWPQSETQLLAALKSWVQDTRGATAYEEIELTKGEAVADLVAESAKNGTPRADVFEGKTSMSATLIRQAVWWSDYADGVWLVLPKPKGQNAKVKIRNVEKRRKYWRTLEKLGLGLIEIERGSAGDPVIDVVLRPADADPGRSDALLAKLNPAHRGTAQAGSAGGSKASAWGLTRQRLREAAVERPGTPLKYLVKDIEHHYASDQKARSELARIGRKDGIPGLRFEGVEILVYPTD